MYFSFHVILVVILVQVSFMRHSLTIKAFSVIFVSGGMKVPVHVHHVLYVNFLY